MQVTSHYNPDVFNVSNVMDAMKIILTPDEDATTEQRWLNETPYLLDLMEPLGLTKDSVVLDYGCGIGRMSRAIIGRYNCHVVGADISTSMRSLAPSYVSSPKFMACHPSMIPTLGVKFDGVLSVWVLQHCLSPKDDIAMIRSTMKPGAGFFVVNETTRFVPCTENWVDDGIDIKSLLGKGESGTLDPAFTTKTTAQRNAYWWLGW